MNASLQRADLDGSNLQSADLSQADLSEASLVSAILTDTVLSGAILDRADLTDSVGLTDEMLESAASWNSVRLESLEQILEAMAEVCDGTGVPEAAAYPGEAWPHPLVVLMETGEAPDWYYNLEGWHPTAIRFTELVACAGEEEERLIQTCYYQSFGGGWAPPIERFQYQQTVRLVAARTGYTVATITLQGDPPRHCQSTEPWNLTRLEGTHIGSGEIREWLERYVAP